MIHNVIQAGILNIISYILRRNKDKSSRKDLKRVFGTTMIMVIFGGM